MWFIPREGEVTRGDVGGTEVNRYVRNIYNKRGGRGGEGERERERERKRERESQYHFKQVVSITIQHVCIDTKFSFNNKV